MPLTSASRRREVELLLERAKRWADQEPEVRAVALVGSWARDCATVGSDIDLVVLTKAIADYVDAVAWIAELGATSIIRTRRWGALTERRLAMPTGLEVDVGFTDPSWASAEPVDEGTAQVVAAGLRILYDPDGVLAKLLAASWQGQSR
jgi:predicted nucleotidyltransferase